MHIVFLYAALIAVLYLVLTFCTITLRGRLSTIADQQATVTPTAGSMRLSI